VFQTIECLRRSIYLDGYKGIPLILEVATFIDNLHLRWVPVWSPALGSLNRPLITTISITRRERERSPTHKRSAKQSLSDYAQ
jgi:hypothetical protein